MNLTVAQNTNDLAVETLSLSRSFGKRLAIDNVNLCVPKGVIFGLLGVNGAGKSTLIKMLMGHLRPTSGHIKILGQTLEKRDDKLRQQVGYVSDDRYLYDWMTIEECLRFTKAFHADWDDDKAGALIKKFDLSPAQLIKQLSRGNRARLSLALALSYNPDLIILDEPTSGLDPIVRREFIENIINEIGREGATVLFSSHIVEEVERIADYVGIISGGRLLLTATVDDLKRFVKKVRFAANGFSPEMITSLPGVIDVKRSSNEQIVTFENFSNRIIDVLRQKGVERAEVIPMSLEEIFITYVRYADTGKDNL